jgi:hypothetical protein
LLAAVFSVFSGSVACDAFVSPRIAKSNQLGYTDQTFAITSAIQVAKKKRRRRKDSSDGDSFDLESGELPDFDMEEENPEPKKKAKANPDEITASMMGSTNKPVRSVNELIRDRALEKVFEFEEPKENLPDLVQLAKSSNMDLSAPVSKKSKANAARKAAAAAGEVKEGGGLFANLPNGVTDENGKVNGPKVSHDSTSGCTLFRNQVSTLLAVCLVARHGSVGRNWSSRLVGSVLKLPIIFPRGTDGASGIRLDSKLLLISGTAKTKNEVHDNISQY